MKIKEEEIELAVLYYSAQGFPVKMIANQLQLDEHLVWQIIFSNEIKWMLKYVNKD